MPQGTVNLKDQKVWLTPYGAGSSDCEPQRPSVGLTQRDEQSGEPKGITSTRSTSSRQALRVTHFVGSRSSAYETPL